MRQRALFQFASAAAPDCAACRHALAGHVFAAAEYSTFSLHDGRTVYVPVSGLVACGDAECDCTATWSIDIGSRYRPEPKESPTVMGDAPPDTPDTAEFYSLVAAATTAIVAIDEIVGAGALDEEKARRYGIRLKALRSELCKLAEDLVKAGVVPGAPRQEGPVYTVEAHYYGAKRRKDPLRRDFTSWEEFLVFLAANLDRSRGWRGCPA